MVIVAVTEALDKELKKRLNRHEYLEVRTLFLSLKKSPYKGKLLHVLGTVVLKELKYKSFRFYFLTSHNLIKIIAKADLEKELVKFVRMSKKTDQARVIQEILDQVKGDDVL